MAQRNQQAPTTELASAAFATIGWIELTVSVILFLLELYLPSFFFAVGSMIMASVIMAVRKKKREYDEEMGRPPLPGPSAATVERNKKLRVGLLSVAVVFIVLSLVFASAGILRSTAPLFTDSILKAIAFVGWALALTVQSNRLMVSEAAN